MHLRVNKKCGDGSGPPAKDFQVEIMCSKEEAKRLGLLLAQGQGCVLNESTDPRKDRPNYMWACSVRNMILVGLELGFVSLEDH